MTTCAKCGSTRTPAWYFDADANALRQCADCGHPFPGDPAKVQALLTGRPPAKPLAQTCHACGSRVLDAALCSACLKNVRRWLGSVPTLSRELDTTIARQTRFAEQAQRVTGTATPPLPLHVDAAAVRDDLRAVLVSWVRFLDEEMG